MNTPTPRTDAVTYPADCLGATLVTNRDCARALERELIALTAELTVALANWNGALERAMKAEADLAALEQCHDDNCRAVVKIAAELDALTAERDQLRDELERADVIYQRACEVEHELRAELATVKEAAK
jgi:chromosome segregation ATPase